MSTSTVPELPRTHSENIELLAHLWEVWQYRHTFLWGALIRWGVAVILVSIIPHVRPQFLLIGRWVLIFPATAVVLTLFSFIHLLGEHQRLLHATRKYVDHAAELTPSGIRQQPQTVIFYFATGAGVIITYLVALVLLSIVNSVYLTSDAAHAAASMLLETQRR